MLGEAVVVAGDGAGPEIGAGADPGVADIGEVVGLGTRFDHRVLDLDEVADVGTFADRRPRPQPGIGPDDRAAGDACAFDMAEAADRSEEHTSELQSLMRISYAVFCLKKKKDANIQNTKS